MKRGIFSELHNLETSSVINGQLCQLNRLCIGRSAALAHAQ
ncbi:hypothetical protein [uncultured Megasphaera sp.]|nr:hypothetical protein [uncultured Megasphaera sp.]